MSQADSANTIDLPRVSFLSAGATRRCPSAKDAISEPPVGVQLSLLDLIDGLPRHHNITAS